MRQECASSVLKSHTSPDNRGGLTGFLVLEGVNGANCLIVYRMKMIPCYWRRISYKIRSLSMQRFSARDGNRKCAVSAYLTCLHTTIFTFVSIFSLVKTISLKIWERPLSWRAKCSLLVAVRGSKTLHA